MTASVSHEHFWILSFVKKLLLNWSTWVLPMLVVILKITFLSADQDLVSWKKRCLWTNCHCKARFWRSTMLSCIVLIFCFSLLPSSIQNAFIFVWVSPQFLIHFMWYRSLFFFLPVGGICWRSKPLPLQNQSVWSALFLIITHTMSVKHLKLRCPSPKKYKPAGILANCFVIICVHLYLILKALFFPLRINLSSDPKLCMMHFFALVVMTPWKKSKVIYNIFLNK